MKSFSKSEIKKLLMQEYQHNHMFLVELGVDRKYGQ